LISIFFCTVGYCVAADAVDIAATFIGKPYHYGCKDPQGTFNNGQACGGGLDCSGLVYQSYRGLNPPLPEGSVQQSQDPHVVRITDPRCTSPSNCSLQDLIGFGLLGRGDLLFFDTRALTGPDPYDPLNKRVDHVGLYESGVSMIDAFDDIANPNGIRRENLLTATAIPHAHITSDDKWTQRFMFAGHVSSQTTITFDQPTVVQIPRTGVLTLATQGYSFTSIDFVPGVSTLSLVSCLNSGYVCDGSNALGITDFAATVVLSKTDGTPFTLSGFSAAPLFISVPLSSATEVHVAGNLTAGGAVSASFNLSPGTFQNFALPAGWTMNSVTFTGFNAINPGPSTQNFLLDNIVVK
jgi:hypothetical protein